MNRSRPAHLAIVLWGVGGVMLLLGQALVRLTPVALEPLQRGSLSSLQSLVYAAWVAFSAYTEGYRAFQLGFAPRVVRRAFELAANPRPLYVALAPAYCMTLFAAPRVRMAISWSVTLMVIVAVIVVRQLAQPWRGIIDGGVVVGLGWGVVCLVRELIRAWPSPSTREASDSAV